MRWLHDYEIMSPPKSRNLSVLNYKSATWLLPTHEALRASWASALFFTTADYMSSSVSKVLYRQYFRTVLSSPEQKTDLARAYIFPLAWPDPRMAPTYSTVHRRFTVSTLISRVWHFWEKKTYMHGRHLTSLSVVQLCSCLLYYCSWKQKKRKEKKPQTLACFGMIRFSIYVQDGLFLKTDNSKKRQRGPVAECCAVPLPKFPDSQI